ncbi:MAG: hypothetical protein HGB08_04415 [Candidatus Moranbacteria bacterium]|nr:hypothetical protein [Candidatus Moranbacteria bacterium]
MNALETLDLTPFSRTLDEYKAVLVDNFCCKHGDEDHKLETETRDTVVKLFGELPPELKGYALYRAAVRLQGDKLQGKREELLNSLENIL